MTNASISQISALVTNAAEYITFIRGALETAGLTYISDDGTDLFMYKELTTGVTKKDINFEINTTFYSSNNTGLTSGVGQTSSPTETVTAQNISGGGTGYGLNSGNATAYTINHPEVSGCVVFSNVRQTAGFATAFVNTYIYSYLYYRTLTVPSYWDENSFLFAFVPQSAFQPNVNNGVSAGVFHDFIPASTGFPTGAGGDLFLNYGSQVIDANPDNSNRRALLTAPSIVSSTNGIVAQFSSDIACVAADGLPIGQQVKKGTGEVYTIIEPEYTANKKMRMAVRTA